jgi:precorrin-6A synthase
MMRRLLLIGIGPGHPDQLTVEAVRALNEVDVFLVADKQRGVEDLVAIREEICRRHVAGRYRIVEVPDPARDRSPDDYGRAVEDWHEARATAYEEAVLAHVGADETAGFLVWGDPALYDSTIRVVERILERGAVAFEYDVVPGISSIQVLAARHRLVLNRVGEPVTVTTGRRLRATVDQGTDNIVVVLDGELTCATLDGEWDLWWGANLGTASESLVAGRLGDVLDQVRRARSAAKQRSGWVMDTYLLRRSYAAQARSRTGGRSSASRAQCAQQ